MRSPALNKGSGSGMGLRREFKFILGGLQASQITRFLAPYFLPDPAAVSGTGEYDVYSVYFDAFNLQTYHDKLAGESFRTRFRLRRYDNARDGFLEKKFRRNELTGKARAPVAEEQWARLLRGGSIGDFRGELQPLAAELKAYSPHPTVEIAYRRAGFVGLGDPAVRITIDRDIRVRSAAGRAAAHWRNFSLKQAHVLEIKTTGRLPGWAGELLQRFNLQIEPLSKYAAGVRHLHALHLFREDSVLSYL